MIGLTGIGLVISICLLVPLWIILVNGGPNNQFQEYIVQSAAITGISLFTIVSFSIVVFKFVLVKINSAHEELFEGFD